MAVVFAMLASYGISRTLTPIIIRLLLRKEHDQARRIRRVGSAASMSGSMLALTGSAISTAGCLPESCSGAC